MALLARATYDPAAAVTKATSSLLAMTALDTTNLRLTFTAPANGTVLVRIRATESGATTFPDILFGVLASTTVIGRQCPIGALPGTAVATTNVTQESLFTVTGLSGSQTWDAAYAVQVVLAATNLHYGGPNDSTANNAWGGIVFEVYDVPNILGAILYDPSVAVSKVTTSVLAMTALDTTNLRITFTAPSSGNVIVRLRGVLHGATTFPQILLGILESSTVVGRQAPIGGLRTTALATGQMAVEAIFTVGSVTGGSHTWDAAYGVETVVASTGLKYGGPNDNAGNDAFGGFSFEILAA